MDREHILIFLSDHSAFLRKKFHLQKIGLIGSFAKGKQSGKSDIDLLIEFEPGTQNIYELKTELRNYLKANLHRDIDLCREKYIKPYIKEYLLKDAVLI